MKNFTLSLLCLTAIAPSMMAQDHAYAPLLEKGKTWKYSHISLYHPIQNEPVSMLKVGETMLVDGTVYFPIYEYRDDQLVREAPVVYMREDIDAHQVWARPAENIDTLTSAILTKWFLEVDYSNSAETLLYDFNHPANATLPVFIDEYKEFLTQHITRTQLQYAGNTFYGAEYPEILGHSALYEGLGLIPDPNTPYDAYSYHIGWPNLLGMGMGATCYPPCDYPDYLFEVTDGEGNVIYAIDEFRPENILSNYPYMPLLEDGKTWRYTCKALTGSDPEIGLVPLPDEPIDLKVADEGISIDGNPYFTLYACAEGKADAEICYLREDLNTHQVWMRPINEFEDIPGWAFSLCRYTIMTYWEAERDGDVLLYDFNEKASAATPNWYIPEGDELELFEYETLHVWFRLLGRKAHNFALIDGLGLVPSPDCAEAWMYSGDYPTLLGQQFDTLASPWGEPYYLLYEINRGPRDVLYSNDAFRPQPDGIESVCAPGEAKAAVVGNRIVVTGATTGNAELYNAQGQLIDSAPAIGGNASLRTPAPGAYIVKTGRQAIKIII